MPAPLEGIRVLDWTIWQQGPVASMMLADMGAEVIKIEEKNSGDPGRGLTRSRGINLELPQGRGVYFETNNRNKRGIALDLKKEKGKEVIYRLIEKSDVFVQNFRKGVAARLGMDYKSLVKYNPKLIYANASGYGSKGPDSAEPSFDYLGLARSGMMNIVGEPDMPPLGIVGGIADQMGAIMLAYGISLALIARVRYGMGQELDVSHLGSMMWLEGLNVSAFLLAGKELPRHKRAEALNPLWNHYKCRDSRWIALAHLQPDRYWEDFCKAIGSPELSSDPRFHDMNAREKNHKELIPILDRIFSQRTLTEWMKILEEKGDFIYCPVQRISDLPGDPQVIENEYIQGYSHPALGNIKLMGIPVKLSKTPGSIRLPAPAFGEHTEEILAEVAGYSSGEIAALKEQEII